MKGNIFICGMTSEAAIIGNDPADWVFISAGNRDKLKSILTGILKNPRPLSKDHYRSVVSFGVCGALNPKFKNGMKVTKVFGSSLVISKPVDRAAYFKSTGMDAVDNETDIAQQFAANVGLPFVVCRVILDEADEDLPAAALLPLKADGSSDAWAVTKSVLGNPFQIPALVRLGLQESRALQVLRLLRVSL